MCIEIGLDYFLCILFHCKYIGSDVCFLCSEMIFSVIVCVGKLCMMQKFSNDEKSGNQSPTAIQIM